MERIGKVTIIYNENDLEYLPSVDLSLIDWFEWAKTSCPLDWGVSFEETDIYEDRFIN